MTREEFKEYLEEDCSIVQDENNPLIFRNPINGSYTRIEDEYKDLRDLEMIHHCVNLGVSPPEHIEDLYYVYQEHYLDRQGNN